jgi:hypothetical protein
MTIDSLLDAMLADYKRDIELSNDDPMKRTVEQRDELLARITRLQLSRNRGRTNSQSTKDGVSRNGIRMGRPRRDLNPESPAKEFLKKLGEVTRDERGNSTEEGTAEGGVEARAAHE